MAGLRSVGLLGRTLNLDDVRYRLEKLLGGGLISQVYLGVPIDNKEPVAVKVLRPGAGDELQKRFHGEYDTLVRLQNAEKDAGTHFFPRPLAYHSEFATHEGRWAVLVMEYVKARPLNRVLLDLSDQPERLEPWALAAGAQYAHALSILHRLDLSCADRKLDDLRWEGSEDSQLVVLDWNVVGGPDAQPMDLFRFGLLWHQLMLGGEPPFEKRETGWQVTARLHRQPGWERLSFGTQQILRGALHPDPAQRYPDAAALESALRAHRDRWKLSAQELFDAARQDFSRGRGEQERRQFLDADTLFLQAFAAADLAKRKTGKEEQDVPGLESLYRDILAELPTARAERMMDEARRALTIFDKYEDALDYLRDPALVRDPEYAMVAERLTLVAKACLKAVRSSPPRYPSRDLRERLVQAAFDLDEEKLETARDMLKAELGAVL